MRELLVIGGEGNMTGICADRIEDDLEGLLSGLNDTSKYEQIIFYFSDQLLRPPKDPEVLLPHIRAEEVVLKTLDEATETAEFSRISGLPHDEQLKEARKWAAGQAHKSFQATVYSYAWNQMNGMRPEIRFDVVTKAKVASFESHTTKRSENMERRMALLISKAQKIIEHELFYPSETGFYCNDCPFKESCKEWHNEAVAA